MGRKTVCSKDGLNKGAWTPVEDKMLLDYLKIHGEGKWSNIVRETGVKRCGKSCRLRWMSYLRPDIKRGNFSDDEEDLIIRMHKLLGNRWSLIAGRLPGRTDNDIKNYWHTSIAKKARGKPKVDRKQSGAASNLKNQSTIESHCTTGVVPAATASQENSDQDHQLSVAMPQFTTSNLQYESSSKGLASGREDNSSDIMMYYDYMDDFSKILDSDFTDMPKSYETESPSKGLASGGEDSSSNSMMYYDYMEDFSKILDSDFTEFSGIHDIISTGPHSNNTDAVNGDHHDVSSNGCKSRETTEFPEKLLESDHWSGNKCGLADQGFDFMSLLSFLDSTDDEWTADASGTKVL
ncbi:hypothetical protein OIU77_005455 [Salix suchowensis]|uniref:Uncharacterized protein n=1 Tax=Salix suchowensis TaxID=1278906 RepID=A0ABQ9APG3_9ROSI|nr:hypothetical protein OIU77_005455 [Salix suchowensis]